MRDGEKGRGVPKFFGVVVGYNHCRTIPRSLLAGILPPSPPSQLVSPISFSFSYSDFFLSLPGSSSPPPHLSSSYFVSRHCPFQSLRDCGANTARYRINFLSRGCRDFTLLERRHWGGPAQSETSTAAATTRGCRYFDGLVSRLERVRVKSSREEN